eukprot:PhM_4_TR3726/c0_g1_i1/m.106561
MFRSSLALRSSASKSILHSKSVDIVLREREQDGDVSSPRRWVRSPDETCVLGVQRVSDILPNYIVHYKTEDPTWGSILQLPCMNPTALEVRGRHINWELRYLAQYGHAQFVTILSQHSVLHPRGVPLRSFVECTHGKNKQILVSKIRHEGYLDQRNGPDGPRGIVAVSMVMNYGCPFSRKFDMVERSRRAGSTQALMGCLDSTFCNPEQVGKRDRNEVFLLQKHIRNIGGGVVADCIAPSWNVSRHPYHYLCTFETPPQVCLDACLQAAHYSALYENKLVKKDEQLCALGWEMASFYPYLPLEVELPFSVTSSRPTVYHDEQDLPSTTIGYPVLGGAPIQRYQFTSKIGNPSYISHETETKAERALHWWNQPHASPYHISMFLTRSSHLDKLYLLDKTHENPFVTQKVLTSRKLSKKALRAAVARRLKEMENADSDDCWVPGVESEPALEIPTTMPEIPRDIEFNEPPRRIE